MKQQVINYLRANRAFAAGVALYNQLPGKSLAFARRLNAVGNTPANCAQLHYELGKAVGLNEAQVKRYLSGGLAQVQEEKASPAAKGPAAIIEAALEKDDYRQLQSLVSDLELEAEGRAREDYRQALINHLAQLKAKEALQGMSPAARQGLKLRQQFPFLKEKSCPPELKILVSDRITAYHNYVQAHKKLHENLKEEEIAQAVEDVVENYLENQLIFKELQHFQEKGEPLGEHPIWAQKQALEEIQKLGIKDLIKKKNSLTKGISTDKAKIAKEEEAEKPDPAKLEKWRKALAEKEFLLQEADRILDRIDQSGNG
jgi:hypothetical protein